MILLFTIHLLTDHGDMRIIDELSCYNSYRNYNSCSLTVLIHHGFPAQQYPRFL